MNSNDLSSRICFESLAIGAVKLSPERPFLWASGYYMPIYNDNRMILGHPEFKNYIVNGFLELAEQFKIDFDIIAGTSTAGIPWASSIQDETGKPMIYVRDKPKDHGLRNQIEGIDAHKDLGGKKVLLIEDLVSTGGSSVKAVQAIRDAKGTINDCFSIFNYELAEAEEMFRGNRPYDKESGKRLNPGCRLSSLYTYSKLIECADIIGRIDEGKIEMLKEWRLDPFNWGTKNGFPPKSKN